MLFAKPVFCNRASEVHLLHPAHSGHPLRLFAQRALEPTGEPGSELGEGITFERALHLIQCRVVIGQRAAAVSGDSALCGSTSQFGLEMPYSATLCNQVRFKPGALLLQLAISPL